MANLEHPQDDFRDYNNGASSFGLKEVFGVFNMIWKMPWPTQTVSNTTNKWTVGFNPRRNQSFILTNEHYNRGKTLLDATFEAEIAPLIVLQDTKFHAIPADGNPQNNEITNLLASGYGQNMDVTEAEAKAGNLLRVEYDPDDAVFSYVFVRDGANEEWRFKQFGRLRTKCARSGTNQLLNKKYLLTPEQYLQLYHDYTTGQLNMSTGGVDIRKYTNK